MAVFTTQFGAYEQAVSLDEILKGVSRSFYLTIRLLPSGMREPVSLVYLLARASDTIADTETVSVEDRAALLAAYGEALKTGDLGDLDLGHFPEKVPDPREELLMMSLAEIETATDAMAVRQREAIHWVLDVIIDGQMWDLTYFKPGALTRVESEKKLLDYTYSVAGSVGEFWTRVGFIDSETYATESPAVMAEWGKHYGQALQLVNILRDVTKDRDLGRIYMDEADREKYTALARAWLDEGVAYSRALGRWRLRVPTVLPALIGHRTLDLIESASNYEREVGVKVPRSQVYQCLAAALLGNY